MSESLRLEDIGLFRRRPGFRLGPITHEFTRGVTAVVGVNGAGKSTLFSVIAGSVKASRGSIRFPPKRDSGIVKVGFLPQTPVFPRSATVEDVLRLLAWTRGVTDVEREVSRVSAELNLDSLRRKRIKHLSGGTLRRLGIAQAMIGEPSVLLLDEPTAGLDPLQRVSVRNSISSGCRSVVTLISTHLVDDVQNLADHVVVLNEGALVFAGSVPELASLSTVNSPRGVNVLEAALQELYLHGMQRD